MLYNVVFWIVVKIISNNMLQPTSQSSILNDRQQLMMKEILSNSAYELKGIEKKACGILKMYTDGGYTGQQAIQGVKSIDNWFGAHPKKTWDDLIEVTSSIKKSGPQVNELRFDPKFIEICKSIGNAPKYQYQMLQIILQIDPDVLIHAQKAELSI